MSAAPRRDAADKKNIEGTKNVAQQPYMNKKSIFHSIIQSNDESSILDFYYHGILHTTAQDAQRRPPRKQLEDAP